MGVGVVETLAGVCDRHGLTSGRIYTNRDFTREARIARDEIESRSAVSIELFNRSALYEILTGAEGDRFLALLRTPNLRGLQDMLRATGRGDLYIRNRTTAQLQF